MQDIGIKDNTEDNLLIQIGKTNTSDGSPTQKEVAQSIGLSEWQSPDQSYTISAPTPKYF